MQGGHSRAQRQEVEVVGLWRVKSWKLSEEVKVKVRVHTNGRTFANVPHLSAHFNARFAFV